MWAGQVRRPADRWQGCGWAEQATQAPSFSLHAAGASPWPTCTIKQVLCALLQAALGESKPHQPLAAAIAGELLAGRRTRRLHRGRPRGGARPLRLAPHYCACVTACMALQGRVGGQQGRARGQERSTVAEEEHGAGGGGATAACSCTIVGLAGSCMHASAPVLSTVRKPHATRSLLAAGPTPPAASERRHPRLQEPCWRADARCAAHRQGGRDGSAARALRPWAADPRRLLLATARSDIVELQFDDGGRIGERHAP